MPTLRDVVGVLDGLYDPRWADSWDAVGTVAGDPEAEVGKVLFAVDPVQAVVDEAVAWDADLVVTHHPLWLKGVTSVAATSPKGRVIHTLISRGIGLHTCHTNADSPALGVSESMALALGLSDVRPLEPDPADPTDKWVVFVPEADADRVAAAMHDRHQEADDLCQRAQVVCHPEDASRRASRPRHRRTAAPTRGGRP